MSKRVDKQESEVLTLSLQFTYAQLFANHAHSQRLHSAASGAMTTALYTTEREGLGETTPLRMIVMLSPLDGLCTEKPTTDGSYRTIFGDVSSPVAVIQQSGAVCRVKVKR